MKNTIATTIGAFLLIGCATLNPSADPVAVRAEQTLSVALGIVDTALKYEASNDLPDSFKRAATKVRSKAADAFISADRVRVAYKQGKATGDQLVMALDLVNSIVGEVRWWKAKSSAGPQDYVYLTIVEAEETKIVSSASWIAAVPMFIDLGKSVYNVVLDIRKSLSQSKEWSPAEDEAFRKQLLQTVTQDHWK